MPTALFPTAHGYLPVLSSPSPVEPCFSPYGHTHTVFFTSSPYSPQFHLPACLPVIDLSYRLPDLSPPTDIFSRPTRPWHLTNHPTLDTQSESISSPDAVPPTGSLSCSLRPVINLSLGGILFRTFSRTSCQIDLAACLLSCLSLPDMPD